jgi:iron-sulfur cluster assembly protein
MITISESAAARILNYIHKRGSGVGIRVGVRTTGCSGLAYTLEYVDVPLATDLEFTSNGARVYVDPKSHAYLDGVTVDYLRNGLNEGFEFVNPNERDRCGCGESFRV